MVNPETPHDDDMVQSIQITIPAGAILNAACPKETTLGIRLCSPDAEPIQRASAPVLPDRVTDGWNNRLASLTTSAAPKAGDKCVDIGLIGMKGGSGPLNGCDGFDYIVRIDASGSVLDQVYGMLEQQTAYRLIGGGTSEILKLIIAKEVSS